MLRRRDVVGASAIAARGALVASFVILLLGAFGCPEIALAPLFARRSPRASQVLRLAAEGSMELPSAEARESYPSVTELEGRLGCTVPQFGSPVYQRRLLKRGDDDELAGLNQQLIEAVHRLQESDGEGRQWSDEHYHGGYTTYGSQRSLNRFLAPVVQLENLLERHVTAFLACPELDGVPKKLFMTDCWMNVMGGGTQHRFHKHGSSTISGTYYVQTPKGSPGICFEDPCLDRTAATGRRRVIEYPVRAGDVVLFESWVRHSVGKNAAEGERIGVSFNYHWRIEERQGLDGV